MLAATAETERNFANETPERDAMMAFCGLPMSVAAEPMLADMAMATCDAVVGGYC